MSNETNSNKIRLRFLNGSNNHSRTSPLMDGSSEISVGTVSLIYGKWGISKSTIHFKGYWHETNGTKIPHEELNVNTYDLNYIFGSDLTLSLGFIFFAEGDAIVHDTMVQILNLKQLNHHLRDIYSARYLLYI